jgi:hypothetical protein
VWAACKGLKKMSLLADHINLMIQECWLLQESNLLSFSGHACPEEHSVMMAFRLLLIFCQHILMCCRLSHASRSLLMLPYHGALHTC